MSDVIKNGNQITVLAGQDIVSTMAKDFRQELMAMLQPGLEELTIDLRGVEMIDSVGLGVFIATHNSINKIGGVLKVVNASINLQNLFKTMGLNRHFEIVGID